MSSALKIALHLRSLSSSFARIPVNLHDCFHEITAYSKLKLGTSLAVQWLRLCTSKAGGASLIPGWGTKTPDAAWRNQKIIKKNKLNLFISCLVAPSCLTVCNPLDCSLPGSSVNGIFQARILEWVAISYSRGSS